MQRRLWRQARTSSRFQARFGTEVDRASEDACRELAHTLKGLSRERVAIGDMLDLMRAQGHARQAAFLIATHDARLLRRCDRVLALCDGVVTTAAAAEAMA